MAFAQLTYRESLRDIEACFNAVGVKQYHLGIKGKVSRSTLADANENRDWRIFADFGQLAIKQAHQLLSGEDFPIELDNAVYALDATVIDLCLSIFPWTQYGKSGTKAGLKVHTLYDVRRNIPSFIDITERKIYELKVLDTLYLEPDAFYIIDRGYFDWVRLYRITKAKAFFVIRPKKDVALIRLKSCPVPSGTGVLSDHIVRACGNRNSAFRKHPSRLRRVRFYDKETDKRLTFLTNNFELPAATIAALYKSRWQVELFFKWIKQHLRIKAFYGTSENAVKIQIWVAVTTYILVAIMKQNLKLKKSLYEILQVLSISLLEKKPIISAFSKFEAVKKDEIDPKQLNLFINCVGH
jgi:hypothetical protein